MRMASALIIGAAALGFASSATAQPATNISYSPEFQTALQDELGAREGEALQRYVHQAIDREFARRGVTNAAGSIDVTIVDADPNRPTMEQLSERPGLDPGRSVSIGGAELRAVLHTAGGETLEVSHRRYDDRIDDIGVSAASTWTAAERAIRQFAVKVADAYVANAG